MKGKLELPSTQGFSLRGRADRIDLFEGGAAAILDYKTGRAPSDTQIKAHIAPQLPLEAAMLLAGAFEGLSAKSIAEFVHVCLTGGETPGEDRVAKLDANAITAEVEAPERVTDTGDYDHLARVAEWSLAGEADE